MIWAGLLWFCTGVHAQILDFSDGDAPPDLGESTFVQAKIEELNGALTKLLAIQQPLDAREDLVLRARIYSRRISIELLKRSKEVPETSAIVIGAMLRFAGGFDDLDDTLEKVITDVDSPRLVEARDALAQFNESAMARLSRVEVVDAELFDDGLGHCLQWLVEAVSLIEQTPAHHHWLTGSVVDEASLVTMAEQRLDELAQRLDQTKCAESARMAMRTNLDFLQRGLAFEEFRPQVGGLLDTLEAMVEIAEALAKADWLEPAEAQAYDDRLELASQWFGDPQRRDEAKRLVARLSISRTAIDVITELNAHRIDLRPIHETLAEAEALMDDDTNKADGREQVERLLALLKPMQTYRLLDRPEVPRELRQVRKSLQDSIVRAEQAIIDSLDRLTTDPLARADPALSGAIQLQKNVLEDLGRLNRVSNWIEIVRRIRPRSDRPVMRRIRLTAERLAEPARRDEAATIFDIFERQLAQFEQLPLEVELAANAVGLASLTGGLSVPLAARIAQLRLRWIETLGTDLTGAKAGLELGMLSRVCTLMSRFIELGEVQQDAALLNRWAGWYVESSVIDRPRRELPARFKLAVAAALYEEETDLAGQLEAIESELPLLELIHALTAVRRAELEALPSGVVGTLGGLGHHPEPDSSDWLIDQRETLAILGRYAHEREHARGSGQVASARRIGAFVNRLADDLCTRIEVESPVHP